MTPIQKLKASTNTTIEVKVDGKWDVIEAKDLFAQIDELTTALSGVHQFLSCHLAAANAMHDVEAAKSFAKAMMPIETALARGSNSHGN